LKAPELQDSRTCCPDVKDACDNYLVLGCGLGKGCVRGRDLELPRGEAGALVARARLVDVDVHGDPGVVRRVDGRRGGAHVHKR
jgi:hypothetical protein